MSKSRAITSISSAKATAPGSLLRYVGAAQAFVEKNIKLYIGYLYDAYPAAFSWFRQYESWLFEEHASLLRNINEIQESLALVKDRMEHSASPAGDLNIDWGSRAAWIGKSLRSYEVRLAEFRGRYKVLVEDEELFRSLGLRAGAGRARSGWGGVVMSREEYIQRRMAALKGMEGDPVAEY